MQGRRAYGVKGVQRVTASVYGVVQRQPCGMSKRTLRRDSLQCMEVVVTSNPACLGQGLPSSVWRGTGIRILHLPAPTIDFGGTSELGLAEPAVRAVLSKLRAVSAPTVVHTPYIGQVGTQCTRNLLHPPLRELYLAPANPPVFEYELHH